MEEVQNNSVDLVVTSPPYGTLDVFSKEGEKGSEFDLSRYHSLRTFFSEISKTWSECERVLRPGGVLICEWEDYPVGSRYYGYPREICLCGDMVKSIEKSGLCLISRWVVKKYESGVALTKFQYTMYDNLRQCTPRAVSNWAYVFAFYKREYKSRPHKIDFTREQWQEWSDGVWNINFQGSGLDISGGATYPVEFAKRCMKIYSNPGDVVLDPFLGCYDERTEVLTKSGWKFFRDITWEDEIAYNGGILGLCYTKPTKILKIPYTGEMLHHISRDVDLLITPDHNVYAEIFTPKDKRIESRKLEYALYPARNLVGKHFALQRDVEWYGVEKEYFKLPEIEPSKYHPYIDVTTKKLPMDLWLEFFGWWIAEGWTHSSEYIVGLGLDEKDPVERLKEVIQRLGFKVCAVKGTTSLVISNKQLWSYLSQFGKAADKYIPKELFELSRRQLRILFESYVEGDGCLGYNCKTVSTKLKDDLQELALKCGYATTYHLDLKANTFCGFINNKEVRSNYDCWSVHIIRVKLKPHIRYGHWFTEQYSGFVYCVEVPTHVIYVRRNGKSVWCGNTGTTMQAAFQLRRSCIGYEVLERMLPIIKAKTQYGTQDIYEPVSWEVMNRYTEVKV